MSRAGRKTASEGRLSLRESAGPNVVEVTVTTMFPSPCADVRGVQDAAMFRAGCVLADRVWSQPYGRADDDRLRTSPVARTFRCPQCAVGGRRRGHGSRRRGAHTRRLLAARLAGGPGFA